MKKMWIKTPFPGERPGEGTWMECNTPYSRFLYNKHKKSGILPVAYQKDKPEDD